MYRTFFGLTRSPFEISPDPYFYYGSARHNEALAAIYYGIRARKGFVVVTGEVGTGKTPLIWLISMGTGVRQRFVFIHPVGRTSIHTRAAVGVIPYFEMNSV
jgi:type II secretory pathway predicted ATPase ExeA